MDKEKKGSYKKVVGLEKVTTFLEIVFNSGNLKKEKPISVLMVAPPSNGKTESAKQFEQNPQIKMIGDCTAYGILKNYENDLRDEKIRYIVIPDLLTPLSRKKTSVDSFIMFVNSSSEEGLSPSKTFAYEIKDYIPPFGWIGCVTKDMYDRKQDQFNRIGLSSRFLVIKYSYSIEIINKIIENIIHERNIQFPKIQIKKSKKLIKGDNKIFQKAYTFSKLISRNEAESIRVQKNLQTFLKASAYTRGDIKVTEKDLQTLEEVIELIK